MGERTERSIIKVFLNEKILSLVILTNAIAIFWQGFSSIDQTTRGVLSTIDSLCVVYFIIECTLKVITYKRDYFKSSWNIFDLTVTIASIPSLLLLIFPMDYMGWLSGLSVLRTGRLLRFLRLLKFIPNSDHLAKGILRASKASVGIFLALGLVNITLAMLATMFFGQLSPEHFGNPLKSSYTILKMFTIEGWYEIPEEIAANHPETWIANSLKAYAILTVLIGGILGMGLANAVFIDEMTADNNEKLEETIELLNKKIDQIAINLTKLLPPNNNEDNDNTG
jgi:voltage-gated sodium channel